MSKLHYFRVPKTSTTIIVQPQTTKISATFFCYLAYFQPQFTKNLIMHTSGNFRVNSVTIHKEIFVRYTC